MHAFVDPGRDWKRSSRALSAAAFAWREAQADARGRYANSEPLTLLAGLAGAADALIIFVLSLVASVLRNGLELPLMIVTTATLASLLMANALWLCGLYTTHIKDGFIAQVGRAVQAWSVVFVILLAIGYLTKTSSDFSRFWAVCWYATVVLGLAGVRLAVSVQIRRWRSRGRLATMVAIVDLAACGAAVARQLVRDGSADARLVGVFTAEDGTGAPDIADLLGLSRLFRIDEIYVLVSGSAPASVTGRLAPTLRRLGTVPTNVRICPIIPELGETPVRHTAMLHNLPMLTVHRRPLGAWAGLIKRAEDLVIGCILLVVLTPLLAAIALAIKLDSRGPVLFRQARQGFNHNVFTVLKFRSMTHRPADPAVTQARRGDQRVTAVGRLLRRTSLDELPQIFNVLRGEMSLVGPRPHAVVHNEQYSAVIDDYLGRHRVQPGITGWAQINGLRGETDTLDKMQKRVEHDLEYIDRWSIGLDLKIIVLTAVNMLFDKNAY